MRAMIVGVVLGVLAGPAWAGTVYNFTGYWTGDDYQVPYLDSVSIWLAKDDMNPDNYFVSGFGDGSVATCSWPCFAHEGNGRPYASIEIEGSDYSHLSNIYIDQFWIYPVSLAWCREDCSQFEPREDFFSGSLTPVVARGAPGPVLGSALPGVVFALLATGLMMRMRHR